MSIRSIGAEPTASTESRTVSEVTRAMSPMISRRVVAAIVGSNAGSRANSAASSASSARHIEDHSVAGGAVMVPAAHGFEYRVAVEARRRESTSDRPGCRRTTRRDNRRPADPCGRRNWRRCRRENSSRRRRAKSIRRCPRRNAPRRRSRASDRGHSECRHNGRRHGRRRRNPCLAASRTGRGRCARRRVSSAISAASAICACEER